MGSEAMNEKIEKYNSNERIYSLLFSFVQLRGSSPAKRSSFLRTLWAGLNFLGKEDKMKLQLTRKRALALTQLIQAGQNHLESTSPTDPIKLLKAGDGILKEIMLQRESL